MEQTPWTTAVKVAPCVVYTCAIAALFRTCNFSMPQNITGGAIITEFKRVFLCAIEKRGLFAFCELYNCRIFLNQNFVHHSAVSFSCLNPLTPVPALTGRGKPRPLIRLWRHPSWLNLTSSIHIFPMMPRSGWLAEWSPRYAQKCSKSWVKNSEQNFPPLHLAAPS